MKNKYFYPIFKLKAKSWIRYWLLKKTEFKEKLSEILTGFSFNLENTLNRKFKIFEILGNSVQDGEPRPDNEVPILSSGDNGSITEKIINKNWLIWELPYTVSTAGNIRLSNIPELEVGENYYFVGKCSDGTQLNYANSACVWHQGNNQLLNKAPKVTFTGIDISSATGFYIYVTSALIGKTISEFMLVKGTYDSSNVPEYVPHKEQTYTIPVQQPMRSIGDVRDCFVKVNGEWKERHNIKRLIFNGTESWNYDSTRYRFFVLLSESQLSTNRNGKCNYYILGNSETTNNAFSFSLTAVLFRNEAITSRDDWKSELAQLNTNGTPLYIDYILATPTDLPCTEEQIEILENLPKTFAGQTNINSPDEVKPFLKIQYWESDTNG